MEEFKCKAEKVLTNPVIEELQTLRKADVNAFKARLRAAAKSNGWVRVGGKNYAVISSDDNGKRNPAGLEVYVTFECLSDDGEYKQLSGFRR